MVILTLEIGVTNNSEEITEACISVKKSKDNANEEPNHPAAAVKSFDVEQSLISIGDNASDNHTTGCIKKY